jgi:site-specific recombinase XerD
LISQGKTAPAAENDSLLTIARAREMFLDHVRAHSPDKPETVRRYEQVLNHFERILGNKKYVEAIDRSAIDTYKIKRSAEKSLRHDRQITPRTINFEVSTLRTFFYYLENERGLNLKNPCAKFKHLKDQKKKASGRISHLLRRFKSIADRAGVPDATLHKFRHTYATRLLESGCDIVTVQNLIGHSDIETTMQYLSPNEELKRKAADRLSLNGRQ